MSDLLIQAIEETLQVKLPIFYIDFINRHTLHATRNFNDLTSLLGTEDIAQRNKDYEIQRWMPGYIMIGNDSGDYGILIREVATNDSQIYLVELGSLSADDAAVLDHSITTWEQRGYPCEDVDVVAPSPYAQRREIAMEAYKASPDFAWYQQAEVMQKELKEIEKAKVGKAIDLKSYLSRKKEIQAQIALHEASNENYLPFNKWWKE